MDAFLPGDSALLAGYRRGDRDVLANVYRTYSSRVLRYLSSGFHVRNDTSTRITRVGPLDLEAAHQDTFLRAFSERARLAYDGLRPFEGFLLAIARSAAVDTLRAAGKLSRSSVPLEDVSELEAIASDQSSPEDATLESELRTLVGRFLARLSPEARRLADLRFVERRSQERAGAELGLSRQEARTHELRLKRALVEFLQAEGWLEPTSNAPRSTERSLATLLFLGLSLGGSVCTCTPETCLPSGRPASTALFAMPGGVTAAGPPWSVPCSRRVSWSGEHPGTRPMPRSRPRCGVCPRPRGRSPISGHAGPCWWASGWRWRPFSIWCGFLRPSLPSEEPGREGRCSACSARTRPRGTSRSSHPAAGAAWA